MNYFVRLSKSARLAVLVGHTIKKIQRRHLLNLRHISCKDCIAVTNQTYIFRGKYSLQKIMDKYAVHFLSLFHKSSLYSFVHRNFYS